MRSGISSCSEESGRGVRQTNTYVTISEHPARETAKRGYSRVSGMDILLHMRAGKSVRVFLVEDSHAVMQALEALVSEIQGATIAGFARDADGAHEAIEQLKP
jgi:hypothetical protein